MRLAAPNRGDIQMQIMVYYIVFVVIGDLGSYAVGKTVEQWSPATSLPVFLACFFVVFWLAWILAVRVTAPATAHKGVPKKA
jgi:hypothetical protein